MPKNHPSPTPRLLRKIKKALDKSTPEAQEFFLDLARKNPRLLEEALQEDRERRRNKQLQPIRERINNPDPYLATLLSASRNSCDAGYREKLGQLIVYEINDWKTPLNAWRAAILSAEVQMPLPAWAGTSFRKILQDYIRGEGPDLAIAFGLKGARGKDSRVHKEFMQRRDHHLSRQVRFFYLRGKKIRRACTLVADQIAKECRRDGFNETIYYLFPVPFNPKTFAQTLAKKIYPRWLLRMGLDGTLAQIDKELVRQPDAEVIKDPLFSHLFDPYSPS